MKGREERAADGERRRERRESPERDDPPAVDAVLSAIATEHRRAVLRTLHRFEGETMDVDELAARVADLVRSGDWSADEQRRRVRVDLHHTVLPKLEASGMLVYDAEAMEVRDVSGELVRALLSVVESADARELEVSRG